MKEELAYNTILPYKSAVSTFCAGGKTTDLFSNFLVQQVLKAIYIQKT